MVGAVAIGASGALYCGVNLVSGSKVAGTVDLCNVSESMAWLCLQEFPPLPINGDTVHGEQCAAALAFLQAHTQSSRCLGFMGFPLRGCL